MEPADGPVELRFSDLGGMVCLDELFLRLPGGCQQFLMTSPTGMKRVSKRLPGCRSAMDTARGSG
jgi:hypothetical protein